MIAVIINWSLNNRVLVLLAALMLTAAGIWSVKQTPVDAIPDLSDVQVIIQTNYPGQAPSVVEQQVTYPLTSAMLSVPGAHTVRGFSFFGDSYVYILFDDDTDMYWARSRVLEYLSQVAPTLPASAKPRLGPDATGVGWVYMYALSDPSGQHDIDELTSLQDWYLKFALQSVPGVSEVATVGGMKKQYQIVADPYKLDAYNLTMAQLEMAVSQNNQEVGASVIEMAEAEYMVTVSGYIETLRDIRQITLTVSASGTPITLADVAEVREGPAPRRGIAELNGEGETVGGIIVMRYNENAQQTIDGVKAKLQELKAGLPDGVEITTVYDRSNLIASAIDNLWDKLLAVPLGIDLRHGRLAQNLGMVQVRVLGGGVVAPDHHSADILWIGTGMVGQNAAGAVVIQAGQGSELRRTKIRRVTAGDQCIGVGWITDYQYFHIRVRIVIQGAALTGEDFSVDLQQVASFHARSPWASADQQRVVGAAKAVFNIVMQGDGV